MQVKFTVSCLVALILYTASTSATDGNGRIVGGHVIHIAQAPYNVQLRSTSDETFCGGCLISNTFILTAAHCVLDIAANNLVVVGGANLLRDSGVRRSVSRITIHPEYSRKTMHSDAAILKLSYPMIGPNISPVNPCSKAPVAGDTIAVTGWGSTYDNRPMSNDLRYVQFPVTPQQTCVNEYHQFVQKNMFCGSGYEAKGHCFGDSGGPGVINGEVCGINSFGIKCGEVGFTSAFTDVFAVRPFIQQATSY